MTNTLEPTKFSIKGIVNVHTVRSVKYHRTVKQEYWHGMAVLHRRTYQWQMFTMSTAPVD